MVAGKAVPFTEEAIAVQSQRRSCRLWRHNFNQPRSGYRNFFTFRYYLLLSKNRPCVLVKSEEVIVNK